MDKKAGPINFIAEDAKLGKNVKIWHFAYVGGSGTEIGDNVMIGSLTHVDYNVKIGDNTRVEGSVYIPPLTRIGKDVFIGPAAVMTNDLYPMGKKMVGVIRSTFLIGADGKIARAWHHVRADGHAEKVLAEVNA